MTCECGGRPVDLSRHKRAVVGDACVIACCPFCGKVDPMPQVTISSLESEAKGLLVSEEDAEEAIHGFFRRAYELGFAMGSAATIKELRDGATNSGRMIRIRAIWPPKNKTEEAEIRALLEMGD